MSEVGELRSVEPKWMSMGVQRVRTGQAWGRVVRCRAKMGEYGSAERDDRARTRELLGVEIRRVDMGGQKEPQCRAEQGRNM